MKLGDIAGILNGLTDARQAGTAGGPGAITYSLIRPNHLGSCNDMERPAEITRQAPVDDSYLLRKHDILLKRLNPDTATLISDDVSNTTFSSNLFIVRVFKDYDPAYIACILENQGISWLNSNIVGSLAAINSISIKSLAELRIPVIEQAKQRSIGRIWVLHKKRKKLLEDLIAENRRLMSVLTRSVTTSAEEAS